MMHMSEEMPRLEHSLNEQPKPKEKPDAAFF